MSLLKRENFPDLVLEEQLPVLEEIVTDSMMEEFEMEHTRVYNIRSMDRGIVNHTQTTGIPAVSEVKEGVKYPLDAGVQGFDKVYRARKYGVIMPITQELLDDNQNEEAFDRAEQLGRSVRETERIDAATIFNEGFTTLGPDGKPLFATDHPLPYQGAGESSNKLAVDADLSLTSLEDMVTVMRRTKDGSGKKIKKRPRFLIVPDELEFLAHELVESEMKPQASTAASQTEVNSVNSMRSRYGLEPIIFDYLTDDDAWFLSTQPSSNKIFWYWRRQPAVTSDFDFDSDVAKMKVSARWVVGFSDFRGVAGTSGA